MVGRGESWCEELSAAVLHLGPCLMIKYWLLSLTAAFYRFAMVPSLVCVRALVHNIFHDCYPH